MSEKTIAPFSKPLYVMVKPAGSLCNLHCKYCYYLEKGKLYQHDKNHIMSDELLERFVREYIESQTSSDILFCWHGGEPLMRPISFYQKALQLQKQYGRGRRIDNSMQTNGTLLNDEWCKFFHENNFLVGLSVDGQQEFYDEYRRTANGKPSFLKVMQGIKLLNKHNVEWNAMAVINDFNADYPHDFYQFFKNIDCHYIQFAPIVERITTRKDGLTLEAGMKEGGELADFSVTPQQWGNFLCKLFDEWIKEDVGTVFIQIFDATLANWMDVQPGLCSLARDCGHAGVMEYNGDVYSCDHFVYPEYKLGNIHEKTLTEMMYSEQQQDFGKIKHQQLPRQCKECEWEFCCHGECPKNRFCIDEFGDFGLNYLCKGFRQFFEHAAPFLDFMKKELENKRPPANVMKHLQEIRNRK